MGAQGEDCTTCGVGCGNGAGNGAMSYVGSGCGEYIQETTYKYIGAGGDFDVVRPRRDFTCLITTCCLLSLLLLIPLLCWLLSGLTTTLPFDCNEGFPAVWPQDKADYCCLTEAKGCATTVPTTAFPETTPTQPPTPFPTMPPTPPPTPPPTLPPTPGTTVSHGPVDPYNCAVDPESSWDEAKKNGAAEFTTLAAPQQPLQRLCHQSCRQHLRHRRTLSIVQMVSPTGLPAGASKRRSGAALFMGKVAHNRVEVVPPLRSHTIARLDSQIGNKAGLFKKRRGAAQIRARVVPQPLEVARDDEGC